MPRPATSGRRSCARDQGLSLAVRGGGHNAAGFATCDDGLVVDLSAMRRVDVDATRRRAVVEGGATWADVDRATQAYGLATPGGAVSDTGVGGLTLGGGLGNLRRRCGLSCDNLLEAEVVTADGSVVRANEREHADLYWALRGGGGNFGVVTKFTFQLHDVGPDVVLLGAFFDVADAPRIIDTWSKVMVAAPDEFSCNCFYWSVPAAPSMPEELHGQPVVALMGTWSGDVDEGLEFIAPFRALARPLVDMSGVHRYVDVQQMVDPFFPKRTGDGQARVRPRQRLQPQPEHRAVVERHQGGLEHRFVAVVRTRVAAPARQRQGVRGDAARARGFRPSTNAIRIEYEAAGHALHWEAPADFVLDLLAFVESLKEEPSPALQP